MRGTKLEQTIHMPSTNGRMQELQKRTLRKTVQVIEKSSIHGKGILISGREQL